MIGLRRPAAHDHPLSPWPGRAASDPFRSRTASPPRSPLSGTHAAARRFGVLNSEHRGSGSGEPAVRGVRGRSCRQLRSRTKHSPVRAGHSVIDSRPVAARCTPTRPRDAVREGPCSMRISARSPTVSVARTCRSPCTGPERRSPDTEPPEPRRPTHRSPPRCPLFGNPYRRSAHRGHARRPTTVSCGAVRARRRALDGVYDEAPLWRGQTSYTPPPVGGGPRRPRSPARP